MNHDAYDRIIDRYLNGEMKPEEEREFQELMKLDPDLNTMFAADAVVGRVLTNDRETLPQERPEAYAHFLGLLATSVPAAQQMAASKSAAASASKTAPLAKGGASAIAGGKGTIMGSLLAGGAIKAIVATVAAVGLAVGTYFVVPAILDHGQKPAVEQQIDRPAASAPALRQSDAPAPVQTDVQSPATVTSAPSLQQESKGASELRAEPTHRAAARSQAKNTQIESSAVQETSVGATTESTDHPQVQPALPKRLPVVTNNTVNTQMKINSKVNKDKP